MTLIIKDKSNNEAFEITEDQHLAVCIGVFDIGEGVSEYQGVKSISEGIMIRWEVEELINVDGEYNGKHKTVNKTYTKSLGEKSTLRRDLIQWRGKEFTEEELQGFNIETIITVPCLLSIGRTAGGRSKVLSVAKLPKQLVPFAPDNVYQDKESYPDWVHKVIDKRLVEVEMFYETQKPKESPKVTESNDSMADDIPF